MFNRDPDGRSKVVDYEKLGAPRVKEVLQRRQTGWTSHQEELARLWLEKQNADHQTEAMKVSNHTLDVSRIMLWTAIISLAVTVFVSKI